MSKNVRELLELEGEDEAVSVNQRALIEKILARYSGEFSVFRELLQNADDAVAGNVEIHFRTDTPDAVYSAGELPNLKTHAISSIMVRNDGFPFREEDWERLKSIASGNPDETKIGTFGVGFYSLFSLCEDPVVTSSSKAAGFYWRGDQLFVKTVADVNGPKNVSSNGKQWTTFEMKLRVAAPPPEPNEFARFLATCLGFTANMKNISLHFDGHVLCQISKTLAEPRSIPLRPNLPLTSPLKILKLISIDETPLQIRATMSRWMLSYIEKAKPSAVASLMPTASSFASRMLSAFSAKTPSPSPTPVNSSTPPPSLDLLSFVNANIFLRIVSGQIKVSAPTQFNNEMKRSTKKGLPSTTKYSVIWTGKEEFDAGADGEESARKVFSGLISSLESNGRVFIGFPTGQSTGNASSISARLISTMERESVDFQEPTVAKWNRELLYIGGVISRNIYEREMDLIAKIYKENPTLDPLLATQLEQRALHLMRFFTFSPSTPSPIVSAEIESAFFISLKSSIILLSQIGPLPSSHVRISNPSITGFTHSIPTIPQVLVEGSPQMISKLRSKGLVKEISLEDILLDLASHPLTIQKTIHLFKWFAEEITNNKSYDPRLLTRLKDAAMIIVEDPVVKGEVSIHPLGSFTTYLNLKTISIDEPLPPTTLPFALSKHFNGEVLSRKLGFAELNILEWTKHVVSLKEGKLSTNLLLNPKFAERVLNTVSKSYSSLSIPRQTELVALLSPLLFIPTTLGGQLPSTSYFNLTLFDDLPIVKFSDDTVIKPALEKVLMDLGVRKHVELQLVFTRLLGNEGKWSHVDLVKYLVSVRSSLSKEEVDKLRKTNWLPKEGEAKVIEEGTTAKKVKVIRYSAGTLFEPIDIFRSLGLPLLEWSSSQTKWRSGSDEAKFLFELGLLRKPSVTSILEVAADASNSTRQEAALQYFLSEYGNDSLYSSSTHDFAFVPAVKNGLNVYMKPSQVYANRAVAILGFAVLAPRMEGNQGRFKLSLDPAPSDLVAVLSNPPQTTSQARPIFAYLSTQVSMFSATDIAILSTSKIIPFEKPNSESEMRLPNACYFNTNSSLPKGLRTLFPTIPDFSPASRQFLTAVGVRDSPSPVEIGNQIISDPEKFLELCNSAENYLDVLRVLAINYESLPVYLRSKMKNSSFFLATRRIASLVNEDEDDDEIGSGGSFTYELVKPSALVINDSPQVFRSFAEDLCCAPQEDLLEKLAIDLGAKNLSTLVRSDYNQVGEPTNSALAIKLTKSIKERTHLFLVERLSAHPDKREITHNHEWIRSHLEVFEVRSIELSLSMTIAGKLKRVAQPLSAYSKQVRGNIHLFVTENPDFFEVASTLVPWLVNKQRSGDTLLLSFIFTTSLNDLRRRGINVDRILNSRKQQQVQAEQKLKEDQEKNKLNSLVNSQVEDDLKSLAELFPDADKAYLLQVLQSQSPARLVNAVNKVMDSDYPKVQQFSPPLPPRPPFESSSTSSNDKDKGLLSRLKKIRAGSSSSDNQKASDPLPPPPPPMIPAINKNPLSRPPTAVAGATTTSTEGIRRNIDKAIRDARPENANSIASESTKSMVQESQSYCDASAGAHLSYVTEVAGLRLFVDRSITNIPQFLIQNGPSISRFVNLILEPVGNVFGVNPLSLHVFYDLTGPLIAFNRGGSIFINHRFYVQWHDEMVQRGELNDAMISVFHTLAHELAHNLVAPHNSEHSFYFSTLCETYFLRMSQLLSLNKR